MAFPLLFKVTLYLLVLDAYGALHLTGILSGPASLAVLCAMAGSWWTDEIRVRVPNYRHLWNGLTGVFLTYAVLDFLFLAESFIVAVVHLLLFLQAYKLYNTRTNRDRLDLLVLTFLQLIAASTLTVGFGLLPIFCLYMILAIWALTLFHLKRETEAALPERDHDLLAEPGVVTPGFFLSSLGVAIASLLLTLAIFAAIPRIGRTYLPFSAPIGTLATGFSERVELGAYGTIQTDPTIAMRIGFPDSPTDPLRLPDLRWRGVAFDHFDGRTWTQRNPRRSSVRRIQDGSYLVAPHPWGAPLLTQEILLEPIGSEVIFGASRILAIQGAFAGLRVDAGQGLTLAVPPATRVRYLVVSRPAHIRESDLRQPLRPGDYPPDIRDTYLQLPGISPQLRRLADALATGMRTPLDIVHRVESYLARNMVYSLDLRRETDRDPLEEFLFRRRLGNCEYFAASMAVLLRATGIPSRVVNGFQRGEWNEVGQYLVVRQRDAHAWVEVFFPQAGWVSFDPTPRAAFDAETFGGSSWLVKSLDTLRMRWHRYVIDYSLGDQIQAATSLRFRSSALRRSLVRTWDTWSVQIRRTLRRHWRQPGLLMAAALLLVAASLWLLRGTQRGTIAAGWIPIRGNRGPSVAFYRRMVRLLARRGHPQPAAATAREFASSLRHQPELFGVVAELTTLYERVRFGGEGLAPGEQGRVAALLQELSTASGPPP